MTKDNVRKFTEEIKTDGMASSTITAVLIHRLLVQEGKETRFIAQELRNRLESKKLIPYDLCPSCKANFDSWDGECTEDCKCQECISQHPSDCGCEHCLDRRADFEDYLEN